MQDCLFTRDDVGRKGADASIQFVMRALQLSLVSALAASACALTSRPPLPAFAISASNDTGARGQLRDGFAGTFDITFMDAVSGDVERHRERTPPTCEELWSHGKVMSSPRERAGVLGCALSHLRTIRAANASGSVWVVILEDDIEPSLTQLWTQSLPQFIAALPAECDVVQLAAIGDSRMWRELRQGFSAAGCPPVLPVRNLWSTAAYIINRRGMADVLRRYERPSGNFDLAGLPCLNADVHLLKDAIAEGRWFTATPPLLTFEERPSRLHADDMAAIASRRNTRKHLHRLSRLAALDWAASAWRQSVLMEARNSSRADSSSASLAATPADRASA